MTWRTLLQRALLAIGLAPLLFLAFLCIAYLSIRQRNTDAKHFDAIVVLGAPANPDGTPGPEQLTRTLESVKEYDRGVAPRIVMTGGAAHNHYVESDVMAQIAESHGVPTSVIYEDRKSKNTIENAYYAVQIMNGHGWHSAEVISSDSHLPRASLIFWRYPISWSMHAAPWPHVVRPFYPEIVYFHEAMYCTRIRLFGFRPNVHLPQLK